MTAAPKQELRSCAARAIADLEAGTILGVVEIAAPPERVFTALASAEIVQWWGAEGSYRTTEWTGEVRSGGRWRASGTGADGAPFSVGGEYLEVDRPRRLVHTWEASWDPGVISRVTYLLEAIDGGTRLTLRHTGLTSRESCAGHAEGWEAILGWLSAHLVLPAEKENDR